MSTKTRQKPQRDRHQEILEAASRVITDRGLAETRIQDIAEECGVSPGLILYYFESKDRLLVEALTYANDQFYLQTARELRKMPAASERLQRVIELSVPGLPARVQPARRMGAVARDLGARAPRPGDGEGARRPRPPVGAVHRRGDPLRPPDRRVPAGRHDADELGVQFSAMTDGLAIQVSAERHRDDPAADVRHLHRVGEHADRPGELALSQPPAGTPLRAPQALRNQPNARRMRGPSTIWAKPTREERRRIAPSANAPATTQSTCPSDQWTVSVGIASTMITSRLVPAACPDREPEHQQVRGNEQESAAVREQSRQEADPRRDRDEHRGGCAGGSIRGPASPGDASQHTLAHTTSTTPDRIYNVGPPIFLGQVRPYDRRRDAPDDGPGRGPRTRFPRCMRRDRGNARRGDRRRQGRGDRKQWRHAQQRQHRRRDRRASDAEQPREAADRRAGHDEDRPGRHESSLGRSLRSSRLSSSRGRPVDGSLDRARVRA